MPAPLPKGFIPRLRPLPLLLALALAVLHARPAHAYDVHNKTRYRLEVWNDPGSYRQALAAGEQGACAWGEERCNPTRVSTDYTMLWVTAHDAHFSCIV